MKKELTIQDWGLMIGQKVRVNYCKWYNREFPHDTTLNGLHPGFKNEVVLHVNSADHPIGSDCKPILRELEQITDEEKKEFIKLKNWSTNEKIDSFQLRNYSLSGLSVVTVRCKGDFLDHHVSSVGAYLWFIKKGIDIFGWIDAGLAIKKEESK